MTGTLVEATWSSERLCGVWRGRVRSAGPNGAHVAYWNATARNGEKKPIGIFPLPPEPGVRIWDLKILNRPPPTPNPALSQCVAGVRVRLVFRQRGVVHIWCGTVVQCTSSYARVVYDARPRQTFRYPPPAAAHVEVLSVHFFPRPPPDAAHLRQQVLRYRRAAAYASALAPPACAAPPDQDVEHPDPPKRCPTTVPALPRLNYMAKGFRAATFNVRTLTDATRISKLAGYAHLHGIDAMGIQETRLHAQTFSDATVRAYKFQLLTAPCSPSGNGGVALLLSPRVRVHAWHVVVPHRVIRASVTVNNASLDLLVVYAPTSAHDRELFTSSICSLVSTSTRPIFVLGDLNGLDKPMCTATGHVSAARHLGLTNGTWCNPSSKRRNTYRRMLDHVLVPRSRACGIKVVRFGQPILSDHRMVIVDCTFEHMLKKTHAHHQVRVMVDALGYSTYARYLFNKEYTNFWFTGTSQQRPLESPHALTVCLRELSSHPSHMPELRAPWQVAPQLFADAADNDDSVLARIESIETSASTFFVERYCQMLERNPWVAWKYIDALTRKPVSLHGRVPLEAHEQHQRALLSTVPAATTVPPDIFLPQAYNVRMSAKDFTDDELYRATHTMRNHAATGPDDIPSEIFRCPAVRAHVLPLLNSLLDVDMLPTEFIHATLVPLYKRKGNADDPSSYRPIVLSSVLLKIIHKMILLRLRDAVDKHLMCYQSAYREGLGTHMSIVALQELVERARTSKDTPLYAVFCDFSNAFSSVHRDALFNILAAYGLPPRLLHFVRRTHEQQLLYVRANGHTSGAGLSTHAGVMQGDTLAPYLFVLVMDQILRYIPHDLGAIVDLDTGLRLPALAYADDVVLLANTQPAAQRLLDIFAARALSFGLHLNVAKGKTEVMLFSSGLLPNPVIFANGNPLHVASEYIYLGWTVASSNSRATWRADFMRRVGLAWGIVRKHHRIWSSDADAHTKKRLFYSLVVPVLLYGCMTYPATLEAHRTLHVQCTRLLRHCLNLPIRWDDEDLHTATADLYDCFPPLPALVAKHFLTQWGHWVRRQPATMHPAVATLVSNNVEQSHRLASNVRGRNWPASRILAAYAGPATPLHILETLPRSRKPYARWVVSRAHAITVDFVARCLVPRSLTGRTAAAWAQCAEAWRKRWTRGLDELS